MEKERCSFVNRLQQYKEDGNGDAATLKQFIDMLGCVGGSVHCSNTKSKNNINLSSNLRKLLIPFSNFDHIQLLLQN